MVIGYNHILFCINIESLNESDTNYDKIKHLVEVDDDILAVFIANSSQMWDLHIAKNANVDRTFIDSVFDAIDSGENDKVVRDQKGTHYDNKLLGKLKWVVSEYENVRVLKIIEKDRIVVVLINSNTQLQHTIVNILGYYYDMDEIPKSLF